MGTKKIYILGTGPSAAFAAMACQNFGVQWEMHGREIPRVEGPVFFHHSLTGNMPPAAIEISLQGSREGYSAKTGRPGKRTSADFYGLQAGAEPHFLAGFPPQAQLQAFAKEYKNQIVLRELEGDEFEGEHVITTLAHPDLKSEKFPMVVARDVIWRYTANFMVYDGRPNLPVRWGNLWGSTFWEFGSNKMGESLDDLVAQINLPPTSQLSRSMFRLAHGLNVSHTPLSWADRQGGNRLRVGRFSEMNARRLSHEAYSDTWLWLEGR